MVRARIISGNTIGNGNVFIQGNANVNSHAEASQKQGENDILERLYTSRYKDQKDRNPPRVPGTCDWFVSHEHFRTWNESNSSAMLWVSADPGCGKSVLVRHLIDSVIQNTESRTVCYFFFKDDSAQQKNITSALSCILRQIFIQKPSLLSDKILKKFDSGGETFTTSFSELWQILMQVAEDKTAGEIVCLLDAIDECEDQTGQGRSRLLKALCTLYGTEARKSSNLKFLLTCRPYVEIHRSLQPLQIPGLPVIHLSGESDDEIKKISREINIYINARVQDIGKRLRLTQGECDFLLQKLMHVPNRTYLWVYLVLDFIENSIDVNNMMIIDATSNIPTTVYEAYERILSKSFNTGQARKALHIIVAAVRPLTLKEMNFALAVDDGRQLSYDDLDLLSDDRFRETLRSICGLCVVIVDSKIYLLHQTVKEFLVKKNIIPAIGSDSGGQEWKHSLDSHESHRILAEICVSHLVSGLKMESGSPTQNNWHEIFLDYSAKYWASHLRQTTVETQSMMTESILKMCDVNSSCCEAWFSMFWTTTNTEFPKGFTTLMMASYFGLNLAVDRLLTMADIDLDTRDHTYQRSALTWAARNGFHLVAKLLLSGVSHELGNFKLPVKKRPKVDLQDIYGRAPLTYAVWNGDVSLVQLLIKAGARANLRDELEVTPLSYAFCNGNVHIINLLAKKQRGIDVEGDINRLLLSAAEKGHEEVVALLLKTNKANVEARTPYPGPTETNLLFRGLRKTIVEKLFKARQGINFQSTSIWDKSETALLNASDGGHEATVKLLLEAGADVNARGEGGITALINASWNGHEATVKLLLEAGADVNACNKFGETALLNASEGGHEATVKLLLEAGADVNACDQYSRTALLNASDGGHEATAKLLLKAGADVNARDKSSETALIRASWNGHEATAKLLLKAGADVNACDQFGETALMNASEGGHEATVKLLLEAGADVNACNQYSRTALIRASDSGHEATAKLLLKAGADVNACDKISGTALIRASWNGHEAIVKLLLKARADVNACDKGGETALMNASWDGYEAIVKLLLEAGADVNACDQYSRTALMRASLGGHEATVKLLLEAGAIQESTNETTSQFETLKLPLQGWANRMFKHRAGLQT